jgi:hypothetical protein
MIAKRRSDAIPYSLFPIPYSLFPIPHSLFAVPEQPVQPRDLADKIIEPSIRRGKLLQRPHQETRRARRPQEEREMRKIAALDELIGHVRHRFVTVFASADVRTAFAAATADRPAAEN